MSDCGTIAGYRAHKRQGSAPCADCRTVYAAYVRAYRHERGFTTSTPVRLSLLREILPVLPEHLAEQVRALLPELVEPYAPTGSNHHHT